MAGLLVVLCFVDTFLTGVLLVRVRQLRLDCVSLSHDLELAELWATSEPVDGPGDVTPDA